MRRFFIGLGLTSMTIVSSAWASPGPQDYAYKKAIAFPSFQGETTVSVSLDNEVIKAATPKYKNINLVNGKEKDVEFSMFFQPPSLVRDVLVSDTSSLKEGRLHYLTDSNVFTTFIFDEKVDQQEASWIFVDLGKEVPLSRLQTFTTDDANIRYLEIHAGKDGNDLKRVLSKRSFNWQMDFNTDPVRYVKIFYTGTNIKITDIKIYSGPQAHIYFKPLSNETYFLLYGNTNVDYIQYKENFPEYKSAPIVGRLGRQIDNPQFPEDVDGDGFKNMEDNCPFLANPRQKDRDEDRVGDECDNALEVKNLSQTDADKDGIGDVIDNCKLEQNPNQKDRDGDGYGDACDTAHAVEPGTHTIGFWGWLGLCIVALIGAVITWWEVKAYKKQK